VWAWPALIARSIKWQMLAIFLNIHYEGKKERKRVERVRIRSLVFKVATVALPINANPYNNNTPMKEHS
jgi:hypothetical protein